MKLADLFALISPREDYGSERRAGENLPRWLAMCGMEIPSHIPHAARAQPDIDIPMDIVRQVLILDAGERATADLRAMGEGIGRCAVNVPANINVWQHLKGESTLGRAAEALAAAAKSLTD